jgi:LysM repeat protein
MYIKNPVKIIFVIGILLSSSWITTAQVTVVKSENRVIIEGKVYFMHVVKAGQTLYSISKAYAVSEAEIIKENPGADAGLQVGQLIKIPVVSSGIKENPPSENTPIAAPVNKPVNSPVDTFYQKYLVKQGETMYSIAKSHNINIGELQRINPQVVNNVISVGQSINIPREKTEQVTEDLFYHKVRRKETIYGISHMYNISEEMLKKYNPELYTRFPDKGEMLKIPKSGKNAGSQYPQVTEGRDTLPEFEIQSYDTVKIAGNYSYYLDSLPEISGRAFNVAYLIPFNYRSPDETAPTEVVGKLRDDVINLDHTSNPNDQMLSSRNFLEFMEGSLLAIDSLKNEGISVNVFIFDTQKSPTRTREILNSKEFKKIDLIIGPFYSFNVEIVSEYSRLNRVPMISPFSGELGPIEHNPFFFQLNPGYKTEFERMSDYVSRFPDRNIIFIHGTDSLELAKYNFLKNDLIRRLSTQSPLDSQFIKEIVYDISAKSNLSADIHKALATDKPNLVVIPEADEAFVSTVMTQLYFQLKSCEITVLGMPHWNTFQNIDVNYFHKLSLTYFTPYYFSYDSSNVKHFLMDYRNTYYAEPVTLSKKGGSYAFLGYDLSYHFLKAIDRYGKRFILHLNDNNGNELMNNFRFVPVSETGGFENRSLMLVRFSEDLEIKAQPYEIAVPEEVDAPLAVPDEAVNVK